MLLSETFRVATYPQGATPGPTRFMLYVFQGEIDGPQDPFVCLLGCSDVLLSAVA